MYILVYVPCHNEHGLSNKGCFEGSAEEDKMVAIHFITGSFSVFAHQLKDKAL